MACDLVGGLYLAYDLFGGEKGPLSTLTRLVNYSLLMIAGFIFPQITSRSTRDSLVSLF